MISATMNRHAPALGMARMEPASPSAAMLSTTYFTPRPMSE